MAASNGPRSRGFLDFQIIGGDALKRALEQAGREGIQQMVIGPALEDSADLVYNTARQNVAIKSGDLRDTIRKSVSKTRARVIAGSRSVIYAGFLEFGTKDTRPQPFMRPALDNNRRGIEGIFTRRLQQLVEHIGQQARVASTGGRGRWSRKRSV